MREWWARWVSGLLPASPKGESVPVEGLAEELVRTALEAMFVMDRADRVLLVNPAAERLFGWTAAELVGRVAHDVLHHHHPDGRPFALGDCPLANVMASGTALENVDDWLIARDGTWIPVRCSQVPRRSEGQVVGCTLVVHDRRETHRMEAALREQAEALSSANRRKDAFLVMLAHELRNPLGAMRTAMEILERQPRGPAEARSRAVLGRQVGHMARLVDDLLDASRIMRGRIELQLQPVDLAQIVRESLEDHQAEFEERGLTLSLELPGPKVPVEGDPIRLHQALDNLLSNARKFTEPPGNVGVRLRISDRLDRALIEVQDTGIGIAPAEIAAMFDSFAQADVSLERSRGGLGLGLALAKGLMELHRGELWGESPGLGQGSTFTAALPLSAPSAVRPPTPCRGNGPRGRRILVIEDNPDAAALLQDLLGLVGHETWVAHTGSEGIALARQCAPEVILCDLGLPGMDGYAVARHLKADPRLAVVELIAVTGYGGAEDRAATTAAGFDHHLVKPVDPDQLLALLLPPA